MRVCIVASEAYPYSKTGGLGDVTGALFNELKKMGIDVRLIVPFYRQTVEGNYDILNTGLDITLDIMSENIHADIFTLSDKKGIYFIKNDRFFMREGLYGTPSQEYYDNALRFAFFSRASVQLMNLLGEDLDIIHAHDWQTGLIPLYISLLRNKRPFLNTKTVFTIHNLGYQGNFHPSALAYTGLDSSFFEPRGIEYYGKVSYLKAGIVYADIVTTVSPNYAREILTEEYGHGFEGILNSVSYKLRGILNGIDYGEWNPFTDRFISKNYDYHRLDGKWSCKRDLMKLCGLSGNLKTPLLGFVGRLVSQKGIELIIDAMEEIVKAGCNLVVVGTGEERFHGLLTSHEGRYPGRVHVKIGYDERMARMVYAGSDIFLMPSRYEPCGLGQMIAMRYGTVPVARKTGGISDTVIDYDHMRHTGTGFLFNEYNHSALLQSIKRALCLYSEKNKWNSLIKRIIRKRFTWKNSAEKYLEIYESIRGAG